MHLLNRKKTVLSLFIILFVILGAVAQTTPQGFNYQTVVRDASGNSINNQLIQIRFSLYSGSSAGILQWQEDCLSTTDSYGLFKTIIGTGISTGSGLATSFNQIDWSIGVYYLKVSIDVTGGSTFLDMGNSQLFSVPYSFYSLNSNNINNIGLAQFSDVNLASIAPNKVLKWDGLSSWVPSNDIHSDTVSFAYSIAPSFWSLNGNSLGTSTSFLGVNDSVDLNFRTNNISRLNLTSNGNLLLGGSSNNADLRITGNDGMIGTGAFNAGMSSNIGTGTRLVWWPSRASFKVGTIDTTNYGDSIGVYSFSSGRNHRLGKYSAVFGDNCVGGDYVIAIGRKCKATSIGAYPSGTGVALGDSCLAAGQRCVAIGRGNHAMTATNVAIGQYNKASGAQSIALGYNCNANGYYSTVIGYYGSANLYRSFVYADASSSAITNSNAHYQFLVRASGGTIFYTDSARTMGVTLFPGGGSWSSVCDKNKKENFSEIDMELVLEKIEKLKIKKWNYRSQANSIKHIGPTAQDFYALFGVGENNISIATIDMDGVILTGIKAVNKRLINLSNLNSIDELKLKIDKIDNFQNENTRLDAIEAALNNNSNHFSNETK